MAISVSHKNCLNYLLPLTIFFSSCGRTNEDPPIAQFTYSSLSSVPMPATVQFTNTSTTTSAPATYVWDFGDGSTATVNNPLHIYTQMAVYQVRLVQISSNGVRDTVTQYLNLASYTGPTGTSNRSMSANFVMTIPARIFTTTFINTSVGASNYLWNFGNGTTSNTDSMTITRTFSAGTFHVNLSASNNGGTDTTGAMITF